jgi:hypothetical protein
VGKKAVVKDLKSTLLNTPLAPLLRGASYNRPLEFKRSEQTPPQDQDEKSDCE